jgi:peptide/nickel transport system substrate-binding protein
MLPPQYFQQVGSDGFGKKPIGTGPYKLVEWVQNDHITMTANPDYWGGAPKITNVQWKLVNDALTRVQALKAGQADLVYQVAPAQVNDLNSSTTSKAVGWPSSRVMVAGFNTFVKPFDDVRVRQALNYAVDKQTILKTVLSGHGQQINSAGSPALFGYDPSLDPYPYDPVKAKQLLTAAGYPNGFATEWYGTQGRYEADVEIQQAIAGYLEAVGVTTKMTLTDVGTFFNAWLAKSYQAIWFFGQGNTILDEDEFLNGMLYSKGRGWYYSTPATDAMIEAARTETDPAKRLALYKPLMQKLHDDAPWIFLWAQEDYWGVSNRLNWTPDTNGDIWLPDASFKSP